MGSVEQQDRFSARKKAFSLFDEFKSFAFKGNVIDLAVIREQSVRKPATITRDAKSALGDKVPLKLSMGVRVAILAAITLPFLGFLAAMAYVWGRGFHWVDLGLLVSMYLLTGLGITVGFHRLFAHRAFETNAVVQLILAALGSMAVQGSLLKWVAVHRRHHQYSDCREDPHSPHHQGRGVIGVLRGVWHAHIGWFFEPDPPSLSRYVADLRRSGLLRAASALFPVWVALGLLIPAVLGGLLTGTWLGALSGLLWGGLARIFLVHHVTWSVNSICHFWGRQPFRTGDQSRNNFLFGALAFGEGWHNNHHAFPTSARFGLRWWQIDLGYWCIHILALLGLASKVTRRADHTGSRSASIERAFGPAERHTSR